MTLERNDGIHLLKKEIEITKRERQNQFLAKYITTRNEKLKVTFEKNKNEQVYGNGKTKYTRFIRRKMEIPNKMYRAYLIHSAMAYHLNCGMTIRNVRHGNHLPFLKIILLQR